MVLPGFLKTSPKKKSTTNTKEHNTSTDSLPSSPTKRSGSKSPTKSLRESRSSRKNSTTRNSYHSYSADTHPLNLPPDERERRRSAMSPQSDPPTPMDIDSEEPAVNIPSSPPPVTRAPPQEPNGDRQDSQMNGDGTPIPPPHGVNTRSSPPPKPAIDPEACKALGNKYFKAQDYKKAIKEYTKGWSRFCRRLHDCALCSLWTNAANMNSIKPLVSNPILSHISLIEPLH